MVSIIILSLKPPEYLLAQIREQTFKDYEIIIAKEKGIVNAMNIALSKAKGEIFVRIDDDVSLPSYWLERLIAPFKDPQVCGVTGPTYVLPCNMDNRDSLSFVNKYGNNPFFKWLMDGEPFAPARIFKCGAVSYGSNFVAYNDHDHIDDDAEYPIDHLEGTNWAMRTDLIREVGGFDPAFDGVAERFDDDVVFKVKKLGYTIKYNPKAWLFHNVSKGSHFEERFAWKGRIKNFLRFHWRHSQINYKMVIWVLLMVGYYLTRRGR